MLQALNSDQVDELIESASGPVSYLFDIGSFGYKTTAIVIAPDGRWTRKVSASGYLMEIINAEIQNRPKPAPIVATGKRSEPYNGPFPRGKHSHRCLQCGGNAVACYKAQCTVPQTTGNCKYCR